MLAADMSEQQDDSLIGELAVCPDSLVPEVGPLGVLGAQPDQAMMVSVISVSRDRLAFELGANEGAFAFSGGDLTTLFAAGDSVWIRPASVVSDRAFAEFGVARTDPIDGGPSSITLENSNAAVSLANREVETTVCRAENECGLVRRTYRVHDLRVTTDNEAVEVPQGRSEPFGEVTVRNVLANSTRSELVTNPNGCSEPDWSESHFIVTAWGLL